MAIFDRRGFVGASMAGAMAMQFPHLASAQSTQDLVDKIVIDFPDEPVNIHPAKAYSDLEWSIVHSVFDALIGFTADGELEPVAASTFELLDETSWQVRLREGLTFHDGSPVTAEAILSGFDLITGSDSLVSDVFGVVSRVEAIDDLTARITVAAPSPWLPAQMASWHVLIPENFDPENPVGSGPYRFDDWVHGDEIRLSRFSDYAPSPTKGTAIAESVVYHFVPESSTRVSNVLSGSSDIASFLPMDATAAFQSADVALRHEEVVGTWFIRIATDSAPFDNVQVRQAFNLALDLDAFVGTLVPEGSHRLASLFPGEAALGFTSDLAPYAYDPAAARTLLAEAGFPDGLSAQMEVASDASLAVCEALVGQWADVGIDIELIVADMGTFNATWADTSRPALRMASWSPVFDPATLLNLVWHSEGILSRYNNPDADALMEEAATIFAADRSAAYRELGRVLHDDAAAVFLWNLVHIAATTEKADAWSPRPDQWIMALHR